MSAALLEPARQLDLLDDRDEIAVSYSELPDAAKERARDEWRNRGWNWDDEDSSHLTDRFAEELLNTYGIEVAQRAEKWSVKGKQYSRSRPDVSWDLSYGQGDYVEFTAYSDIDQIAAKNRTLSALWEQEKVLIAVAGWEYPPNWRFELSGKGCRAEVELSDYEDPTPEQRRLFDQLAEAIQNELSRLYKEACKHLTDYGYKEIDYLNSDEYLDELLENCPHYLFTEEGEFHS